VFVGRIETSSDMWARNYELLFLYAKQVDIGCKFFMAWMYILQCSDGSYYVGSTRNLDLRFSQHQQGKGSQYTSTRLPVQLVYYEEYDHVSDAYAREKQVQGWSRRRREALINGTPELLPALAKKVCSKNKITDNTVVE
jgi:putative endonuclease